MMAVQSVVSIHGFLEDGMENDRIARDKPRKNCLVS